MFVTVSDSQRTELGVKEGSTLSFSENFFLEKKMRKNKKWRRGVKFVP